jgi:hypothetical protein
MANPPSKVDQQLNETKGSESQLPIETYGTKLLINSNTILTISTDIDSSPAHFASASFITTPAYPSSTAALHQPSNYDDIHYDATSHHQLQQRLPIALDSVPPYSTTSHSLEQNLSTAASGVASTSNVDQNVDARSRDEVIHDIESYINNFQPRCKSSHSAIETSAAILNLNEFKAKWQPSTDTNPTESFEAHKARCMPRHVSPPNKTFSISVGYSSTMHTHKRAPTLPRASAIDKYAPIIGLATTLCTPHATTSYSGTLEVYTGSDTPFDIGDSSRRVEHYLESPQLVAWVQQRCAKIMTLSEKMEMNKDAWLERL